jgi:peptide/nickel transport system permease protein
MRLLPGDPILLFVSQDEYSRMTSQEEIDALRAKFGLDKSLPVQYVDWINGVLHGDLGQSIFFGTTVKEEIADALPVSLHLGIIAFIAGILLGVPGGVICAIRRGRWIDSVLTVLANLGITIPIFWLGILMIYVFGLYLGWLPIQGYTSPFDNFWLSTRQIVMPVICLILFPVAGNMRQGRSAMLEVVRQDYIRTAWAKGLSEKNVVFRHAIRNGIIPLVTLIGMGIPHIFGGQVLIETVFNIPGMGRLAVDALFSQDYAIVQGITLLMSTLVVCSNLLVDVSYGWIDPRVRYS